MQLKQTLLLSTNMTSHIAFKMEYLTLAHPKVQGQGYAQFDCEDLSNGKWIGLTLLLPSDMMSQMGVQLTYLDSIYQGQGHAHFDCECVQKW